MIKLWPPLYADDGKMVETTAEHLQKYNEQPAELRMIADMFMGMTGYTLGTTMVLPLQFVLDCLEGSVTPEMLRKMDAERRQ